MSFNPEYTQSDAACEGPCVTFVFRTGLFGSPGGPFTSPARAPLAPAPESAAAQTATASNLLFMVYLSLPQWTPSWRQPQRTSVHELRSTPTSCLSTSDQFVDGRSGTAGQRDSAPAVKPSRVPRLSLTTSLERALPHSLPRPLEPAFGFAPSTN